MEWVTTSTILDGLRNFQNDEAWSRLVRRFQGPVAAFGRALGLKGSDAEDLAQATLSEFVRAFRDNRYDQTKGRLSSYLFGIAHHQALRIARDNARGASSPVQLPGDAQSISIVWEAEWERAVVEQCLERARAEVEPQAFAAFELVVQRGFTPAAAAQELGVPVKFVYNSKHRVLSRLRQLRSAIEQSDEALTEEPPVDLP